MIRSLEIHNFKAFERIALRFGQLTVITGVNSSGKSSVLQAIALAEIASTTGPRVQLNGSLGLALGEAQDVLNHRATEQLIELITTGDTGTDTLRLAVPQVDRSVVLERIDVDPRPGSRDWYIGTYLCAERLGPRDLSEVAGDGADRVDCGHSGSVYCIRTGPVLALSCTRPTAPSVQWWEQPSANARGAVRGMAILDREAGSITSEVASTNQCRYAPFS